MRTPLGVRKMQHMLAHVPVSEANRIGLRAGCLTVLLGEFHKLDRHFHTFDAGVGAGPGRDTSTHPLTNPSRVLTTSSTVGRLIGSADRHFSMNLHFLVARPSYSAACGLADLFPWLIWMTTVSFLMFPKGMFPVNTSTTSFANAKKSCGLGYRCGFCASFVERVDDLRGEHREVPTTLGVTAIAKVWFEMTEQRP